MKFEPKYIITNEILCNIRDIHKTIAELNSTKIQNTIYSKILYQQNIQKTYTTLSMNYPTITLNMTKNVIEENKAEEGNQIEQKILNYYKTIIKSPKLKNEQLNSEFVKTIQKELMSNVLKENIAGQFREENTIFKNQKTGKIVYVPPKHTEIKDLLKELIRYVNRNKEEIDPIILAAIFQKQFLIIHPFIDGNGNTCQLITKKILSEIDFNFFNLLNIENFHKENSREYFKELLEFGNYNAIKNKIDFTNWLEYFTKAILFEILKIKREILKQKNKQQIKITKDQEKIIQYIEKNGYIDDNQYSQITKRKKSTRVVDFNKLIEMDLIERKGKARKTYYTLKN